MLYPIELRAHETVRMSHKKRARDFKAPGPEGGERGRNRTFNLWIKSPLLCQLSYAPPVFSPSEHHVEVRRLVPATGRPGQPKFDGAGSIFRPSPVEGWGEQWDLNPQPPESQSGALTN